MIIGNFKNDSSTNLVQLYTHSLSNNVYIYIDNVSLTPCTGLIENSDHKAVNVFPSPFQEKLNITSAAEGISEVLIYDFSSRIVIQKQFTFSISLNTAMLPQGIYFYQVINNRSSHCSGKILKN
jgi:hypothetical protein